MTYTIIRQAASRATWRAGRMLAAAGGVFLLASCSNLDVPNTNAPTADELTGAPSRSVLGRAAVGIQTQAMTGVGGQIQQWGIYGRELYNLAGTDPRETGEEISGPQLPGSRAGGLWNGHYQAIRTINTYLHALDNVTDMPPAEVAASRGFAKTVKAWLLQRLAVRSGATGMPIDVDRPIDAEPAPLVSSEDAMKAVAALLDEALADLNAGSAAFPFSFVGGYDGFDTPATFVKFNRALKAKSLVQQATFFSCAQCWQDAKTAMDASFVTTTGLPASLKTGVYYGYTGAPGEAANPVSEPLTSTRYWVHPSIISGVQLRGNGQPDLRLSTKAALAPDSLVKSDLIGKYKPVMYNDPSDPSKPDRGAYIPWISNEELLLLRAEIRWNTGDKPGALSDIDAVRVNAGGLNPTSLTAASSNDAFVTELLYNRVYSLMWTQGTRWVDARRYNRTATLPLDRAGDVIFQNMLIPSAECDARGKTAPCSISGG